MIAFPSPQARLQGASQKGGRSQIAFTASARLTGYLALWRRRLVLGAAALALCSPVAASWIDATTLRPSTAAEAALASLRAAAADGLVPADYATDGLARQADALRRPGASAPAAAAFAEALDAAFARYLRDLHRGRVAPKAVGFRVPPHDAAPRLAEWLAQARDSGRVAEAVTAARPSLATYRALRDGLAAYRLLQMAEPGWPALPVPAKPVRPGDTFAGLAALHIRLAAHGDLPASVAAPGAVAAYDGPWVEAVQRFQARHGLEADGVLGRGTLAALQVPIARRLQQIELAMERLRWLPPLPDGPIIGVNIPMYRLFAWDAGGGKAPVLDMRVIVGKALNTQTPVMLEDMTYLVFRPYWNVPRSIAVGEIVPRAQRDAGYLARSGYELVAGPADSSPVVPATAANIERLRTGSLRVRQVPGPRNALGLVKFIFPNDAAVYLHGTPAPQLFDRDRRDFSHGCVRVQDPTMLAQWLLEESGGWSRDRIEAAMAAARPQQVNLPTPVPVILFYLTAAVLPPDGRMHFADDIYRHDERLLRALAARRP